MLVSVVAFLGLSSQVPDSEATLASSQLRPLWGGPKPGWTSAPGGAREEPGRRHPLLAAGARPPPSRPAGLSALSPRAGRDQAPQGRGRGRSQAGQVGGAARAGTWGSERLGAAGWEEEPEKRKGEEGELRKGESGRVAEGESAPGTSGRQGLETDSHFWKPLCPPARCPGNFVPGSRYIYGLTGAPRLPRRRAGRAQGTDEALLGQACPGWRERWCGPPDRFEAAHPKDWTGVIVDGWAAVVGGGGRAFEFKLAQPIILQIQRDLS